MSQFKNLVFEGGGVKGIAYAGALQVLQQQNILSGIKRVAGTSAGAITAALVALGANAKDVEEIVGGTKFLQFMDDSFGYVRDVDRLMDDFGWYKGDAFSVWMQKQIYALCQNSEITFIELARLADQPDSKYKKLFVISTNVTQQMPAIYSAETTPNDTIWEAVRTSMSIPLFFAAIKRAPGPQIFVDGGVTWNYALDIFDDKKYLDNPAGGVPPKMPTVYDENHIYNKETLGFRVDTADEIKYEKENWRSPPAQIHNFVDYLKAIVGYMGDMANKLHLHQNDWHRTIALDAAGCKATDFNLPKDKVNLLLQNGIQGATKYFEWFNNPASNPAPINRL